MITALANATIFTGKNGVTEKAILIENKKIKALVESSAIPEEAQIIDYTGRYIAPGLIDLQIYGGGGYLFSNKPSAEALQAMGDALVKTGTTAFMLTLATNSMEIFREALRVVKKNTHPALLGLHFEGPYLNPAKKGAHIEQYIKTPTIEEVQALLDEAEGNLKMMTIAPERVDPSIIRLLLDHGVIVSAGHSNATFEEGVKGFGCGIQTTTHLFNAMSPFHHRDTGLPGAVFQTPKAFASIIADGIHVDYQTLSISKKLLKERLFLITDAVEENPEGAYVHVKQKDRFTLPDGTLSGSNLTLLTAIKNCVLHAAISLDEAVRMATLYPAQLIRAPERGRIEEGAKADLVVFDKDFTMKDVFLNGERISGC
ncbi:MAG TPA: N-acetylglucosamine-6-phosphate deacetylase [Flavisolibacter sp.]|nr:N-acetylglucosamine-6-phosphate deacetylase [Flavisolibacter sp.]